MGHVMCPVTLPCLKLRALAGRSLSVFLSLSIQAVAYLPVEYSSRARNGDPYGKEAEMYNELGFEVSVSCSVLPFCFFGEGSYYSTGGLGVTRQMGTLSQ